MHELVVSPFLGGYFVLRPGRRNAVKISRGMYAELRSAGPAELCPSWLADAVRHSWDIDISGRALRDFAIVREPSSLGYGRASYELNMGCNYDCKRPPHRVTLSVYGATEASYDGLTRRRGAYRSFMKGLNAAREAGVSLDLSVVVTTDNACEVDAMHAMADRLGIRYRDYHNLSPTIYGGAEPLPSQSLPHLTAPAPFTGCGAGHTSFHVDPHGRASICKIGREPSIALAEEGTEGLRRLGGIADRLLHRQGGCAGCSLSAACGTCMPLAAKYRQARAPLNRYCQHGKEVTG